MRTRESTAVGLKCPRPGERQPRGVSCQLGFLPNLLPSKFSFPTKLLSSLAVARVGLGFPQTAGPSGMSGEDTGP